MVGQKKNIDQLLGALRELIDRIPRRTCDNRPRPELMPIAIALLRAVNLGPHNRIKMETLRGICESLGCRRVQTLVQSGNALFEIADRSVPKLAGRLEQAIEAEVSFRPRVITRTLPDMRRVVADNPFADRTDIHPSRLLVTFLSEDPTEEARQKVLAINTEPEELHLRTREVYMYFPNGVGRPKTSPATIERALKVPGTGRNWNVVTKLLALAEEMEKSRK